MAKADFKNLQPEDRIKKLKKLEQKKQNEIAQAKKEIKKSEDEITDRKKWIDRVPIPEFAREDLGDLSEDARGILEKNRGIISKKDLEDEPEKKVNKEVDLEETISREKVNVHSDTGGMEYGQHISQPGFEGYKPLSKMDMQGISTEIKNIYQAVEERGYITGEEQSKVSYALSEVEKRLEDVQDGKYKNFNEQVANAANLIQKVGGQMYTAGKGSGRMYHS